MVFCALNAATKEEENKIFSPYALKNMCILTDFKRLLKIICYS